jgi:SAM-dependent methyltransferase
MEPIEYEAMHNQEHRFWWYRALHNIMVSRLQTLELPTTFRLLDAGCGTGGMLKKIRSSFPQADLVGLEYHSAGIQYLRQLERTTIINGDINKLPFVDDTFDVITLTDVLYHINIDPHFCLQECRRVLKPGGHLLANVAAYQWMFSRHDKQVHTRERYTASQLRQQLQQNGFEIHHAGYWNSLLFPLMVVHRLTAGKIKQQSDVENLPDWQNRFFYRIIHLEQFLQQHRIHIPFGGSAWAWARKP